MTATRSRTCPADRLGLSDPSRFVTVRRVAILDAHPPILKTVRSRKAATPANPDGLTEMLLTATAGDLATIARVSNGRAASGRPPVLQIGHTPTGEAPEAEQPKAIGFADGFEVGELEGRPHLFADFHYRVEHHDEAITYPRLSVERIGFDRPDGQGLAAIALIRRPPERDLPAVPYASDAPPDLVAFYSKVMPHGRATPSYREAIAYAAAHKLAHLGLAEVRRRMASESPGDRRAALAPTVKMARSHSSPVVEFATANRIADPAEAHRRFEVARARGEA